MSYTEMSDVRSTNDDSTFDADIKFGDKRTNSRFTKQRGNTRWMLILQLR